MGGIRGGRSSGKKNPHLKPHHWRLWPTDLSLGMDRLGKSTETLGLTPMETKKKTSSLDNLRYFVGFADGKNMWLSNKSGPKWWVFSKRVMNPIKSNPWKIIKKPKGKRLVYESHHSKDLSSKKFEDHHFFSMKKWFEWKLVKSYQVNYNPNILFIGRL